MTAIYDSAVKQTFSASLRSVFLVDDAFPNFADMFGGERRLRRFKEKDRANRLYEAFRKRHLPCDIENTFRPNDIKMVERLRKCDLIVLDFHLDIDESDNSKSIEILRRLADSSHFNTVVVYTKADLKQVWLDVAANLRPDLRLKGFLDGREAEKAWWEEADTSVLQLPAEKAVASYLTGDPGPARAEAVPDILQHGGQGKGDAGTMADAWVRSSIDKRRPGSIAKLDDADALGIRALHGRFEEGRPLWLQCRGCFIAIVKKVNDQLDEAAVLLEQLNAALLDWKPNFVQLLVSEIQNKLELELLAADPAAFSDMERQVGLSHYLLEELSEEDDQPSTLERLTDRIVETIRTTIANDSSLHKFADELLTDIRKDLGDQITSNDKIKNAHALAHASRRVGAERVVFLLNAFLSTEKFARSRLTTGTVFEKGGEYWVVTSPACDLTARMPGAAQPWLKSMHPVRAMLAAKLEKQASLALALRDATNGKFAFIYHGGQCLALRLLDGQTEAPSPEMFFTLDAGRVVIKAGIPTFKASRILRKGTRAAPSLSAAAEFLIIGQLRANYASRVLQLTGAHLARIGIDFFNWGEKKNGDAQAVAAAPAQ